MNTLNTDKICILDFSEFKIKSLRNLYVDLDNLDYLKEQASYVNYLNQTEDLRCLIKDYDYVSPLGCQLKRENLFDLLYEIWIIEQIIYTCCKHENKHKTTFITYSFLLLALSFIDLTLPKGLGVKGKSSKVKNEKLNTLLISTRDLALETLKKPRNNFLISNLINILNAHDGLIKLNTSFNIKMALDRNIIKNSKVCLILINFISNDKPIQFLKSFANTLKQYGYNINDPNIIYDRLRKAS